MTPADYITSAVLAALILDAALQRWKMRALRREWDATWEQQQKLNAEVIRRVGAIGRIDVRAVGSREVN